MLKRLSKIATITLSVALTACNTIDDSGTESSIAPIITLDTDGSVYTTKIDQGITVKPSYEYLDKTSTFDWSLENTTIGSDSTLTFTSSEAGQFYILLTVTNSAGDTQKELRIDVAQITPPTISLPNIEELNKIALGLTLNLTPVVTSTLPVTYSWQENNAIISTEKDITFSADNIGTYNMVFAATNEDGESSIEFTIEVCDPSEIGFSWKKEQSEYNVSVGRTIRLSMVNITGATQDMEYKWLKNEELIQTTSTPSLSYTATAEGIDTVVVQTTPNSILVSDTIYVNVCPKEGTYYMASSGSSSATFSEVYEYLPAPGQFINDGGTSFSSMDEACSYATERLTSEVYLSLGGFGGYVVVGFDHSVDASSDYNLAIKGNAFSGSSEPGIVWVMQDENGDGLPNDTWYELAGSEYSSAQTTFDYEVTYYRPSGSGQDTPWTDNQGNSGTIDYSNSHTQDYYYPTWVTADSYTLRGTLLESRCEDTSGTGVSWVLNSYDWGYADNYSTIDRLTDDENYNAEAQNNHFKISNAVRFDGEKAELDYIDFVKVQCAVNFKCGWLGEVSTEVCGFSDFNLTQ